MRTNFFRIIFTTVFLFIVVSQIPARAITVDQLTNEYPDISSVKQSGDIVQRIRTNVSSLLSENKHRNYPAMTLAEDTQKVLWFKGFEISVLAQTLPLLDPASKTAMQAYLKKEMTDYLLSQTYRDFEVKGSMATPLGNLPFTMTWWQWGAPEWEELYAFWAYAQYTGDWQTISQNWSTISDLYNSARTDHKKVIALGKSSNSNNSEIAGRVAYARMAKTLYSQTSTQSYSSTYQSALSNLNSRISILSTQASYGPYSNQICGFQANELCPTSPNQDRDLQLFLTQYDFLTPELGRYMHDAFASQTQTVISSATTNDPWWYMAYYDLAQSGGEGYNPHPAFATQIFQAKAQILGASPTILRKEFPWTTEFNTIPHYWDIFTYQNSLTLIRSSETVTWKDVTVAPTQAVVQLSSTPTPVPTATSTPTSCNADFNADGFVDISDYGILVQNFFRTPILNSKTDINTDGIVDLSDYSAFVKEFFKTC